MKTISAFFLFLLALVFLSSAIVLGQEQCVYTIFIKTGWLPRSGTDANIGGAFYSSEGKVLEIGNFSDWGLDPKRNFFERNAVDVFGGYGRCVDKPICKLSLASDGSGEHHGWFVDSVEITTAQFGVPCSSHQFEVNQWLARDVAPYNLTTVKDDCSTKPDDVHSLAKIVRKFAQ